MNKKNKDKHEQRTEVMQSFYTIGRAVYIVIYCQDFGFFGLFFVIIRDLIVTVLTIQNALICT